MHTPLQRLHTLHHMDNYCLRTQKQAQHSEGYNTSVMFVSARCSEIKIRCVYTNVIVRIVATWNQKRDEEYCIISIPHKINIICRSDWWFKTWIAGCILDADKNFMLMATAMIYDCLETSWSWHPWWMVLSSVFQLSPLCRWTPKVISPNSSHLCTCATLSSWVSLMGYFVEHSAVIM